MDNWIIPHIVTKLTILIFLLLYLLVKSSSTIFIICIQKHFQSIILQMSRTNYFLSNSFIITQLFLKLKLNQIQSLRFWIHRNVCLNTNNPKYHFRLLKLFYIHFSKRCINDILQKPLCLSPRFFRIKLNVNKILKTHS